MPEFDKSKQYAKQESVFFNDGREEELAEFITNQSPLRGSPKDIIAAIDKFGRTKKYLMNIGEDKGKIVTDVIKEHKPKVMVELGAYAGYSTILFGEAVRQAGGQKYLSLERESGFARNVSSLVDFAGLSDFVEVVTGPSNESIKRLHSEGKVEHIDMLFLDHYKPAYLSDLKLCESLGLISDGTVLVADNVITPGNPPYLKYVRSSVEEKRARLTREEGGKDTDHFPEKSAAQYGKVETMVSEAKGDPSLVYDSRLVKSFEPTGVPDGIEITRCIGVEN